MEYTKDYIINHADDFIVKEASITTMNNGLWNYIHGNWRTCDNDKINEIEHNINWVYGILPYLHESSGKMYGLEPVKGFIYKSYGYSIDGNILVDTPRYYFTSAEPVNELLFDSVGVSVQLNNYMQSDMPYLTFYNALRMFSTYDEAKKAANEFKKSHKIDKLKIDIKNVKCKIDELTEKYNKLLEKCNKLINENTKLQ